MSSSPTHRLAGSGSEYGGLILKSSSKSKQNTTSGSPKNVPVFKKPTTSLLGLDRLARKKREEREADPNFIEKKPKLNFKDPQSNNPEYERISFGKGVRSGDERRYRGTLVETPSNTGGVSEAALQRIHSRLAGQDQRVQGVYASTAKQGDKDRRRDQRPGLV